MKVLIFDDDLTFGEALSEEFLDEGYEVEFFQHLKDFPLDQCQLFDYAVVDLRLQNESGLDIIKALRTHNAKLRIIVLTGFGSTATTVSAIKNGADDYLHKPIDFKILINTLKGESLPIDQLHDLSLAKNEREYIEMILEKCQGNISRSAKILGIHRQSLQRLLKKYPVQR